MTAHQTITHSYSIIDQLVECIEPLTIRHKRGRKGEEELKVCSIKGRTIKTFPQQTLKLLSYETQIVGENGGKCSLIVSVVAVARTTHVNVCVCVCVCGGATRNES